MYVALQKFVNLDHAKLWKTWEERISLIAAAAAKIEGVTTSISVPPVANRTPTLNISWDINKVKFTKEEFQLRLRQGEPSIEVIGGKNNSINITSWNLQPGQDKIVARRVKEELGKASV